jgi:DNA-binding transcriptional LysR family regulator
MSSDGDVGNEPVGREWQALRSDNHDLPDLRRALDMKSITSERGDGDFATPRISASKRQFDAHAVDWDLYRFFVAVAEAGSLSAAAERLRVSEPTVGRKITELEAMLGCALFLRSTRGLVLTQAGHHVSDRVSAIGSSIAELHRPAAGALGSGTRVVRLTASEGIGLHWVSGLLPGFLAVNPNARVEIIISNQSVDLNNSEADVALRLGSPGPDLLCATRVANVGFGLYASHDYIRCNGMPKSAADLLKHRFIGASGKLARFEPSIWFNRIMPGDCVAISSDSLVFNFLAAENGLGVAMLACIVASKSGRLVRMPIPIEPPVLPLWLVTHAGTRRLPVVQALVQYISARARHDARGFAGV